VGRSGCSGLVAAGRGAEIHRPGTFTPHGTLCSRRTAMTCHLWAIGEGGSVAHPTWMSTALAAISGWSAVWLTGALVASWVVIVVLGWTKRGPATRRRRLM
jgi:hypothetical protein